MRDEGRGVSPGVMEAAEVAAEIAKTADFLVSSGGGVTFSGGEPLCQPDFICEIISHLSSLLTHPSSLPAHPSSLPANYFFSSLAGLVWGMVATFLKMGEPLMGEMRYISFAVVMAGMVMFSSLFGVLLGEWRGTGAKTRLFLATGLVVLILSFVTISICK